MRYKECIFVAIDTYPHFQHNEFKDPLSYRCYEMDFLLESVKMSVFTNDFLNKSAKDLFILAGTLEDLGTRSDNKKENIWYKRKVVNTIQRLIKMNRVTFLRSIEMMESEPLYEERETKTNYFMMVDKDFMSRKISEIDSVIREAEKSNRYRYEQYAEQFDNEAEV